MITLHFHLQPQYKYELFHINFTLSHCTGRYELNKLTSLPMCGFIAQLVEHCTGIAEVTGSNPVEALIFFRLLLSNCLNWKIYCDDHSSLWLTVCLALRTTPFWTYYVIRGTLTSIQTYVYPASLYPPYAMASAISMYNRSLSISEWSDCY